jgi:hypothetical protein
MKDAPEDDFEGILKEARLLNPTKDKGPKDDQ